MSGTLDPVGSETRLHEDGVVFDLVRGLDVPVPTVCIYAKGRADRSVGASRETRSPCIDSSTRTDERYGEEGKRRR